MHDFGKLVYLDLPKTGSNYVSAFLRHASRFREVKFKKHGWIGNDYREDATYFITVREPLSLYSSLYRYGLDQNGDVYERLAANRSLNAYSSFDQFVDFVLQPRNAALLGFDYNERIAQEIGFMSFRYLKLSLQHPMKQIQSQIAADKPITDLRMNFITRYVLKNEHLNEELSKLSLQWLPDFFYSDKAIEFLKSAEKINASSTPPNCISLKSPEILTSMLLKESLLCSLYKDIDSSSLVTDS